MGGTPPPPEDAPVPEESAGPEQGLCPRCGTPYEPLQEYCLECGLRLPASGGLIASLATGWKRRIGWYPGDWVWPVLLALVIAVLAAAVSILWTRDEGAAARETVVGDTSPLPTTNTETEPSTLPPTSTVPTQTTAPKTQTTRPQPGALTEWPSGRSGYTIVLASLPSSGGRGPALAKARDASRAGLPQVGVLDSSRYSSLHPGYFVVFSGVYGSFTEAQNALPRAQTGGYPKAYARRVTS